MGRDSLVVHIPSGTIAGNEGRLHIKVKTKKEGRILYEGDLGVALAVKFVVKFLQNTAAFS
jgi:hypothetical protein